MDKEERIIPVTREVIVCSFVYSTHSILLGQARFFTGHMTHPCELVRERQSRFL